MRSEFFDFPPSKRKADNDSNYIVIQDEECTRKKHKDDGLFKKPAELRNPGKNADAKLKQIIWDKYIGAAIKKTVCPLCNTYEIYQSTNSGFEAAHITAKKFNIEMNHYQVYPSCASCNNLCKTMCLLDYLYCNRRIAILKKIIGQIYQCFIEENGDSLSAEDKSAWKVLDHLYGKQRYPAGGGIQNTEAIYTLAKAQQLVIINEKIKRLAEELQSATKEYALVAETEFKTMKL